MKKIKDCNKEELFEMDAVKVYKLVLQGKITRFPAGFWMQPEAKQNAGRCVRFLIEEILNLSEDELKEQLSKKIFITNKLNGMISICFNNSPYNAINAAYPGKFKPWEFKIVGSNYWRDANNIVLATRWLIEEKLKLSDEEVKEQLSIKLFIDNGLKGMLDSCKGSPFKIIDIAYPGKFKPWEFKITPTGYWDDINNAILATKWLVEEKLKLSDEELKEQLSMKLFINNGLKGMLGNCFNYSPYKAIDVTYPNKFKSWEFNQVPNGYWDDVNNVIKATKWLIEEKLKLSDEELKKHLSSNIFNQNGLGGMLRVCFNGSPYEAINTVYPGKFKKEDFKNYR